MNYKEFMITLIDNKAQGVYLFSSKEEFLNDTIIDQTKDMVSIPDFNLIDLKGIRDIESLKNAYETYPVMEEKKYIIWRGIDLSQKTIREYEAVLPYLIEDIKKFPDYAVLMIISDNLPFKNSKFYKAVDKYGTVVHIDRLQKNELESFIGRRFQRNGKKIQRSLIADIIDRFSYLSKDSEIDLYEIVNVVDKIIANSSDEIVQRDDVTNQLDEVLNLNIFNLTDALSYRNSKNASEIYLNMAKEGEDVFMIYHMIIRQVRNLIGVKTLYNSGYNDNFMMKNLGIGAYELKKLKTNAGNFSLSELFDIHSRLLDMEIRQKSVDFDMKLELLLLIENITRK